jgi:hypothetical protein
MTAKKIEVVVEEEREIEFIPEEVAEETVGVNANCAVLLGSLLGFTGAHDAVIFPGLLGYEGFYVWQEVSRILNSGGIVYLQDGVEEWECEHAERWFERIPGQRAYRKR